MDCACTMIILVPFEASLSPLQLQESCKICSSFAITESDW